MAAKSAIARVLYKEIKAGDRRKFIARSNDEPADGGGARDLRFSGLDELRPVIEAMFPTPDSVKRKRKMGQEKLIRHGGTFKWREGEAAVNSQPKSEPAFMEPPTNARPNEWRLTRVHAYSVFQAKGIPEEGENGRVLLLLVQTKDGAVWPHFTTERSLKEGPWNKKVSKALLDCIRAKRPKNRAVIGYIDFENNTGYCNA